MDLNGFERQIEESYQRLRNIQENIDSVPDQSRELLEEAIATLSTTVEELNVSLEELHQQNQELSVARQETEAAQQRYQELFEYAPEAYIVTNQGGIIQEANQAAAILLNRQVRFMLGKPLSIMIAETDRHDFCTQLQLLSKQSLSQLLNWELHLQPRQGEPLPVLVSVSTLFGSQDDNLDWRWLLRDLRQRKQAEADRQELAIQKQFNELKTNLLRSINHEFRTPLNIIQMSTGFIERSLYQNEAHKQRILERVRVSVSFMCQLLDEISIYYQTDTKQLALHPAIVEPERLCLTSIKQLQNLLEPERKINFICPQQCASIVFDAQLLQQILRNLLSNAVKYSSKNSVVDLQLDCTQSKLIFEVRDEGIGICETDLPLLFEPFFRGSNVSTQPGTGLGLAIVKKALDLCGGEITVESKVDIGTTFTVTLPLNLYPSRREF